MTAGPIFNTVIRGHSYVDDYEENEFDGLNSDDAAALCALQFICIACYFCLLLT